MGILSDYVETGQWPKPNKPDQAYWQTQSPEDPEPSIDELEMWLEEGGCEATDGCWVEPDGICPHGCNSWLLELGLI